MARISKAAYARIDINEIPSEFRQEVIEDAVQGGGEYGIVVVEEVISGPATVPIYGYYFDDPETQTSEKWEAAKEEFGITVHETDEEAALDAAEAKAKAAAEAADAADAAGIAAVTGEDAEDVNKPTNKNKR